MLETQGSRRSRRPVAPYHLTILVPTYRRPRALERCLAALANQRRLADTVIVIYRDDDEESQDVLARTRMRIQGVRVGGGGVVAALNAGLEAAPGDIVAITDDDAAPHADWLALIEAHYVAHPEVGGVGGRDHVQGIAADPETDRVGILQWFGRRIGKHHVGTGPPRYVDFIKGVNMSFRRDAIAGVRFDERLRGTGAQVHNEFAFCLAVRKNGWRLLYDPAVAVDHYPAERFDENERSYRSSLATRNAAYNETLTLLEYFPLPRKLAFLTWAFVIGGRESPGLVQSLRLLLGRDDGWLRMPSVLVGRLAAVRTYLREIA